MKWSHLPASGALYDQHPRLISEWEVLFAIQADVEKKKADADKRKAKAKSNGKQAM